MAAELATDGELMSATADETGVAVTPPHPATLVWAEVD